MTTKTPSGSGTSIRSTSVEIKAHSRLTLSSFSSVDGGRRPQSLRETVQQSPIAGQEAVLKPEQHASQK